MAATKYFEVYNDDRILTIDDSFQNLNLNKTMKISEFVKCEQRSEFVANKLHVYQYYKNDSGKEWEAFIAFDVYNSTDEILAFSTSIKDDDIKIFPFRLDDRYFIYFTVPYTSTYGSDEASLKKYLSTFKYSIYGKYTMSSSTGCGIIVYNESGSTIFNSNLKYMRVKQHFFKCTENLTDAQTVFEKTYFSYDENTEIAPFSACQFWRYTPQVSLNYRTYIKFTSQGIQVGISYYGGFFNQGDYGANGALEIVTSLMLLEGY